MVEPHRQKAVFWHSIWQSSGRPNRGEVRNIMASTRNKYHNVVRKCKKLIGATKARKLLEASEEGHVNLLEELKRMKGSKKQKGTLPATVAGATGEEAISEEFRKEYSALYNSHHDEEAMRKMSEELEAEVTDESVLEVNQITAEVVELAMRKVKPGKGDVTGSYTSDAI